MVSRVHASHRLLKALVLLFVLLLAGCNQDPVWAADRKINTIIIHHSSGSPKDERDHSAAEINRWHKERGWSGIGYHFVIRKTGAVEKGRDVNKVGAHAKGRNSHSIGICVVGYSQFTLGQKMTLAKLVWQLCARYPIVKIERHHEKCPGPALNVEGMAKCILAENGR